MTRYLLRRNWICFGVWFGRYPVSQGDSGDHNEIPSAVEQDMLGCWPRRYSVSLEDFGNHDELSCTAELDLLWHWFGRYLGSQGDFGNHNELSYTAELVLRGHWFGRYLGPLVQGRNGSATAAGMGIIGILEKAKLETSSFSLFSLSAAQEVLYCCCFLACLLASLLASQKRATCSRRIISAVSVATHWEQ